VSSRIPEPCPATRGEHDGELRFYTNGWLCDRHAPWAVKGLPAPAPGAGIPASAVTAKTT
jgi:hypothetical protein